MKRILAITLCLILVLSACTMVVSALPGIWGTSADDFAPVGELEIDWDPDVAYRICLDGDPSEWEACGYTKHEITPRNMVSWVGTVDADWKLECFFVADSERLYVAFCVTDSDFGYGSSHAAYNAGASDAFQIALDWGHNVGDALVDDEYAVYDPMDIFYSFNCIEGEALQFKRDNSDRDGMVYEGNPEESWEELDDFFPEFAKDNEWVGMEGAHGTTENGWCAEFSVTWQRLASDAYYKLWDAEFFRTAKIGPNQDLEIGCALYYLNSAARGDGSRILSWAAGTTRGATDETRTPQVNWTTDEDGLTLVLKYQDGMTFGENTGIEVLAEGETEFDSAWHETEPAWDETEPAWDETEPETWRETESESETEHGMTSISGAESVTFRGWASLGNERIAAYGYVFDDDWNGAVWSTDFIREAEPAIKAKAGSDYATRYEITVEMPAVSAAKVRILRLLVRAEDGSLYELANWDVLALKAANHIVDEDGYGYVPISPVETDRKIAVISPVETDRVTIVITPDDRVENDDDDDDDDDDDFHFDFEGCSSVIGVGTLAVVLSAMAAAAALKRRH